MGLLTSSESSYTVADFWRFMVVHLWVEDFLEIFTTVLVAYSSSCWVWCASAWP